MEYQTDTTTAILDAPPETETEATLSSPSSAGKLTAAQQAEYDALFDRFKELNHQIFIGEYTNADIEERRDLDCRLQAIMAPIRAAFLASLKY